MSRIFVDGQWFDQLSGKSLYEKDYERLLMNYRADLFPEHHLVRFAPIIQSDFGSARPDLALVERSLRRWWVVEVELGVHSLRGHVLPQVAVLAAGRYGPAEAEILCRSIDGLEESAATDLVKGAEPVVIVVTNEHRPMWEEELDKQGVTLLIVEIFRSERNNHALRVSGAYPTTHGSFLSECRVDPTIPGLLVIEAPAQLPVGSGGSLWIEVDGSIAEWERIDVHDKVWLKPRAAKVLEAKDGPFRLVRAESGRLQLFRTQQAALRR